MVRQHTPEEVLFREELARLGIAVLIVAPPPIADMHAMWSKTTYNPTGSTLESVVTMMAGDVARMAATPTVFIQSFATTAISPEQASVEVHYLIHHV